MAIRHLKQRELADRWNISHRTLERCRWVGEARSTAMSCVEGQHMVNEA